MFKMYIMHTIYNVHRKLLQSQVACLIKSISMISSDSVVINNTFKTFICIPYTEIIEFVLKLKVL